jgi:hypothetical protein
MTLLAYTCAGRKAQPSPSPVQTWPTRMRPRSRTDPNRACWLVIDVLSIIFAFSTVMQDVDGAYRPTASSVGVARSAPKDVCGAGATSTPGASRARVSHMRRRRMSAKILRVDEASSIESRCAAYMLACVKMTAASATPSDEITARR